MEAAAVRPFTYLADNYSEISRTCHETNRSVIITADGREDTAVLSYQQYRKMTAELDLLRDLSEAEDDYEKGRISPARDTLINLREELSAKRWSYDIMSKIIKMTVGPEGLPPLTEEQIKRLKDAAGRPINYDDIPKSTPEELSRMKRSDYQST